MYNTNTYNFEQNIIKLINESNLHISTIKLIMDKLNNSVDSILEKELEKEKQQLIDIDQDITTDC